MRDGNGSLLLARRQGYDQVFVGSVGTGGNARMLVADKHAQSEDQSAGPAAQGQEPVFVQPTLLAEIALRRDRWRQLAAEFAVLAGI
ncbi:hypothetical protein ATY76_29570 [Rhizobium sp. R339]|uniref:hypothetical protein n=1 Tax=Rhizobium sp. R339 TaxID=1764273 RepID=UPI000B53588B|nr:hypothetical protein [Rhizobium sp. R339]OWV73804.1 hypothetical protein ATY76_29570 [Rhizobium sp. R339]